VVSDVEVEVEAALWLMSGLDRASTFRRPRTSTQVSEEISMWFGRGGISPALFVFLSSYCSSHCCSGFSVDRLHRCHMIAGQMIWSLFSTGEVHPAGQTE